MKKTVRTSLKIVYTGGGTSGHRAPIVAVHQALRRLVPNLQAWYIGTVQDGQSADVKTLQAQKVTVRTIAAGKYRRYLTWQNVTDLGKVWRGYWQAKRLLKELQPDIIFAKGGFVTVPVVRAAKGLKIPVVSHESDVVMGLANRLNAKVARTICTAYPIEYYRGLDRTKLVWTGNLIRQELVEAAAKKAVSASFKIGGRTVTTDKSLIVVLGGSQGAHRINELIIGLLPTLAQQYRVIHQTGAGDIEWLNQKRLQLTRPEQQAYFPIEFMSVDQLGVVLKAASLVVSRAGSMVSELVLFGVPTILIPLSTSAGGHQLRNALVLENKKAARIINEGHLTARGLLAEITKVLTDTKLQQELRAGMQQLKEVSGAKKVAEILIQNAR
ncbi:MAG: UDP-N-acetylglucosamine--N-acetylmuramyl-(pentapeptide) pyrophosphoryl-undecaprenol N-acetylglucosamine transferase [bacterium]|nr:UDP-N-acetylglucosamine--N-acetylmuramyl-(pentapeptide) pyrophosphoryl-undecaprenol N-acetylglucosamine transferase [bacterium]